MKMRIALFAFAFLLYCNTLTHQYALDDAIVIYDNMFVEQGINGIPGLLSNDTFYGFFKVENKAKLVSGGRYRPLTPILFALEWQIFKKNPFVGHLINVLLFSLLVLLLFNTTIRLLQEKFDATLGLWIAFISALLFAAHPIHTECVANIKGRDEIVALIASLASLNFVLKYIDTSKIKYLAFTGITFFLGLMSKENTITFFAVIPLAIFLFRNVSFSKLAMSTLQLLASIVAFLAIRTKVLGLDFGGAPMELMNNPFIKIVNGQYVPFEYSEKLATIMFTLGKYISLLCFPHPLTHDYYPRHIDMMTWDMPVVWLSLIMYAVLIFSALFYFKKHKLFSFSVLYFIITLSIVSNIVFPIGTNMGERFMFMPSVGFCLLFGAIFTQIKNHKIRIGLLMCIITLFSIKTITRNTVWKDDFTLFTSDVLISKNSAKVLNAAGGALSTTAYKMEASQERTNMLIKADGYLEKAIKIHPNYKNAYLLLGNANYYLANYEKGIKYYDQALRIDPNYNDAHKNLGICLRDAGRVAGEEKGDLNTALKYLQRSYDMNNTDRETVRLLGVASGISGNNKLALKYFQEVVDLDPNIGRSYLDLGTAYRNLGDTINANKNYDKAKKLDPSIK